MTNADSSTPRDNASKKTSYLPRIMPAGAAVILLMILIPLLKDREKERERPAVEPPLALSIYSTGSVRPDSLANEGLRLFGAAEYDRAARCLAEAHFHWNVKIREGEAVRYPADLRFYLGLSHYYRGRPEQGVPFLQEEERENPFEAKYPWYLAQIYGSLGRQSERLGALSRAAALDGSYADKAREALGESSRPEQPDPAR